MSSAFAFNPRSLVGVEPQLQAGLRRHMRAREAEINRIERISLLCSGGPFAGKSIELESGQTSSAEFTVGKWAGRYAVRTDLFGKPTGAEWRST